MKIYVIEKKINEDIVETLNKLGYVVLDTIDDMIGGVILVAKVAKIKEALDVIDIALAKGIEVICIKQPFGIEGYTANHCIKDGSIFI